MALGFVAEIEVAGDCIVLKIFNTPTYCKAENAENVVLTAQRFCYV